MPRRVVIVDYGIGNLLSVRRAFEHCGGDVGLSGEPERVARAERLVLPGVGAFGNCMASLRERGLAEAVAEMARSGRPWLGICVGMQMMLDSSEEFGEHQGLGLVSGRVSPIPIKGADGRSHKIPHVAWAGLQPAGRSGAWDGTILAGIEPGAAVYFIHSFTADPSNTDDRLADTDYDGRKLSAVIRNDNLYGCQFHPEKSGPVGLRIIENFLELAF